MKKAENIQLFRTLACLGVFITHLAPRLGIQGTAASITGFGAMGVYLFFIISGYLVGMTDEKSINGSPKIVRSYYIRRLFRVLPLYYAVILYNLVLHTFILQDVTKDPGGLYWLRYLFLTNAFVPAPDNFWGNLSATWTVSLFVCFYLTAPLWKRLIRNPKGAVCCYLTALILRYLLAVSPFSAYMTFIYYLHFFLLGMAVWQMQKEKEGIRAAVCYGMLAGFVLLMMFVGTGEADYFITWSLIFGAVILLTGSVQLGDKIPGRIIRFLDRYSYSIYLVHAVVMDAIYLLQGKVKLPPVIVFVTAVGLTAVGVAAAEFAVERPAKKLCARLAPSSRI